MSKERPILFSGAMVRALLAGTKTQTRRVVKPQPPADKQRVAWYEPGVMGWAPPEIPSQHWHKVRCPYGQPGDRLWVRETFIQGFPVDPLTDSLQQWDADGNELPKKTWYRADNSDIGWTDDDGWQVNVPWKPSIHMPRAASRIALEITSVRVERLQDISDADCVAEGCGALASAIGCPMTSAPGETIPRAMYRALWESINGSGSWDANPWVWAVEFRKITP